jgi:predicted CoA-substrate-specific enzyme activase
MKYIGIDIGSTCSKTTVLDENAGILLQFVQPTGWSSVDTSEAIRVKLLETGIDAQQTPCVATGYGRASVPYADKAVTEITCHAKGSCKVFSCRDMTVIDIGGQDTKIISIEGGMVKDFIMNDKCSAGTGRFLEVMGNTLAVSPEELCSLAARGGDTSISSMCTVFAESEVISLIGRGEKKENIAFAVVDSIVQKVASQAKRLMVGAGVVCLTGGLCDSAYILGALSGSLRVEVISNKQGRYAGAIGAALHALKDWKADKCI